MSNYFQLNYFQSKRNHLHGFVWLVGAIVCALAATGLTAAKDAPKNKSTALRTVFFPTVNNFGTLFLIQHDARGQTTKRAGTAFGLVKIAVPADEWFVLELSRQAFAHPEYLDACSATGLDGISFTFLSMDDKENDLSDVVLKHVTHFKNLKYIKAGRSDATDAGLSQLADLRDIEFISAWMTRIHGDCFKTFSQFKNLRAIELSDDDLRQENLKYLTACPLSNVDIRRTGIGDLGVKYLSKCSNMEVLRLGGNRKITDKCIKDLLNLKHVYWLDAEGTSISFNGLKQLKAMNLNRLSVTVGLCAAKDLPVLKKLAKQVEILPLEEDSDKQRNQGTEVMFGPMH